MTNEKTNGNAPALTEEDLRNLEIIFLHARKTIIDNEEELLRLISFKKTLAEKIGTQESGLSAEDLRNLDVVFLYARRANVENETELLSIIQFRRALTEKISAGTKPV